MIFMIFGNFQTENQEIFSEFNLAITIIYDFINYSFEFLNKAWTMSGLSWLKLAETEVVIPIGFSSFWSISLIFDPLSSLSNSSSLISVFSGFFSWLFGWNSYYYQIISYCKVKGQSKVYLILTYVKITYWLDTEIKPKVCTILGIFSGLLKSNYP